MKLDEAIVSYKIRGLLRNIYIQNDFVRTYSEDESEIAGFSENLAGVIFM